EDWYEVDDRLETREEGAVDRPDPEPPVAQEGAPRGGEEVPPLGLGGHHGTELRAAARRGTAGAHQRLRRPRRTRVVLGRWENRKRHGLRGRRLHHIGQGPLRRDPL